MKENLVIIHGWGKKESWHEVLKYLDKFNIYLLDLPGFDFSLEKPYTFDDYINYLEKYINDKYQNKSASFYLLGHSFGGVLAMLYALKNPEKIKKLILYNPAILRVDSLKTKVSLFLAKIFKIFEKILPKKLAYFLKKAYYKFVVGSYDYFLADENLKKTFETIRVDLRDRAKELKVKTVLLWGKYDKVTPLRHGEILKNIIQNSELIIFEGGHSFHKEDPLKFSEILKSLIK